MPITYGMHRQLSTSSVQADTSTRIRWHPVADWQTLIRFPQAHQ